MLFLNDRKWRQSTTVSNYIIITLLISGARDAKNSIESKLIANVLARCVS